MVRSIVSATAASCLMLVAAHAGAQDKSQYTLFNPTPTDQMRPFSTDRPTKSNVPYTVDAGHFQYEGDIFIYTFDNTTTPDTDNTSWLLFNPTFKAGLTNWADLGTLIDYAVDYQAERQGKFLPGTGIEVRASAVLAA